MWEDPANSEGGRVSFRMSRDFANYFWENLLLALIGDQFPKDISINGVNFTISAKKL